MAEPGWLDVAGGKLTTYRLIAEETVDRLVRFLDLKIASLPHGRRAARGGDRRARRQRDRAARAERRVGRALLHRRVGRCTLTT